MSSSSSFDPPEGCSLSLEKVGVLAEGEDLDVVFQGLNDLNESKTNPQ